MTQQPHNVFFARNRRKKFQGLWFERVMALLALTNFGLVLFDWSYIPWRDFYFKNAPQLTEWYGAQFKGIEPHQTTTKYLATVEALTTQVSQTGIQSPEVNQQLQTLRTLSVEIIDENPFEAIGKSGTLERIKNRMRDHVGVESSKLAFQTFWSQDYLTQADWDQSVNFFQQDIQPLLARNYYRNIGENGEFIDRFWQLDIWFIGLFATEFLARTFSLSRRYQYTTWLDAMIWRLYDLPLLLPFWRWLRIVPVLIRLDQARLVNFQPINNRLIRSFISSIAVELTEMVVLQVIDQVQDSIRQGEVSRWLLQPHRYIDLNGVNETELISKHLVDVLVYHVLPQVKPEVEALLCHSVTQVLNSSPVYASLQRLPGVSAVSHQVTQQIVADLSNNTYSAVRASLEDETGAVLMGQLVARLGSALSTELKQNPALDEIQALTVALLEEIKVNYVRRLDAEDHENQRIQAKRIYEMTQHSHRRAAERKKRLPSQ